MMKSKKKPKNKKVYDYNKPDYYLDDDELIDDFLYEDYLDLKELEEEIKLNGSMKGRKNNINKTDLVFIN